MRYQRDRRVRYVLPFQLWPNDWGGGGECTQLRACPSFAVCCNVQVELQHVLVKYHLVHANI